MENNTELECLEGSDELKLKKVWETKIEVYEIEDDWIGCGLSKEDIENIYPNADEAKTYLIKKDNVFQDI